MSFGNTIALLDRIDITDQFVRKILLFGNIIIIFAILSNL